MGIIFSNINEDLIREMTDMRTLGSVPFGGRYRMIDFPLSSMVNSGINKVAVITKRNYQSLMDHLGSGKPWDLSRNRDGLYIFPPFGNSLGEFNNRIDMISAIGSFIKNSMEEYVLMSDCNIVCNIDYKEVIENHIKNNADITLIYRKSVMPKVMNEEMVFSLTKDSKISQIRINPDISGRCNCSMNMILMKRQLLLDLVYNCQSQNKTSFERDILQKNVNKLNMYGYEFAGFSREVTSMSSYFEANMMLMKKNVKEELFSRSYPIYTKIRDDMPTRYGLGADVKNSMLANGCMIDGTIENSIIFRGVKIGKGTIIKNSVIMQDTIIGENCNINYIITDKDVRIKDDRMLMGFQSYPVYISKDSVI